MNRTELEQDLARHGLAARAADLARLSAPSIRLQPDPMITPPTGSSMIGGSPHLPSSVDWPTWRDRPLAFVAQIRLDELVGMPGAEVLPPRGMLYFFYDAVGAPWGFDPEHAGSAVVVHSAAEPNELTPRDPPAELPERARFLPCAVCPEPEISLAPDESLGVIALDLSDAESEAYWEYVFGFDDRIRPHVDPLSVPTDHRLLGHPVPMQGDMQRECQVASHGINTGDLTSWDDPRTKALEPGARDWRLLLQLDTEAATRMAWGDAGKIYYWIRDADLRAARFDRCWLILQSC